MLTHIFTESLIHWIVSLLHRFTVPLIHWVIAGSWVHEFATSFQPLMHSTIDPLNHYCIDLLIHCFTESSIQWFIGSLSHIADALIHMTHWFTGFIVSLMSWFIGLLIHRFIGSLVASFIASVASFIYLLLHWFIIMIHSLSCARILSCHVIGISTAIAHSLMHLTTWKLHCLCIAETFL